MGEKFAPGDVVKLKSGGRRCTVETVDEDTGRVRVVSMSDDGTFDRAAFDAACLEHAS